LRIVIRKSKRSVGWGPEKHESRPKEERMVEGGGGNPQLKAD